MSHAQVTWSEVGALLLNASDACIASQKLSLYLQRPSPFTRQQLVASGVAADLVDDLRGMLPTDSVELDRLCDMAGAWAIGKKSVQRRESWTPVFSGRHLDRSKFDRLTGETMIGMLAQAESSIRLFSAYVDVRGMSALVTPLVTATRRGVRCSIAFRARADQRGEVAALLRDRILNDGNPSLFSVTAVADGDAFPHLKLLAIDGSLAYIGSANVTITGLTDNVEAGARLEGLGVAKFERLFDELIADVSSE